MSNCWRRDTLRARPARARMLRAPCRIAVLTFPGGQAARTQSQSVSSFVPRPDPCHVIGWAFATRSSKSLPSGRCPRSTTSLSTLWSRLLAKYWRREPAGLLPYTDPAGYKPLRQAIAEYITAVRAVRCDPEQIIVVSGAQQALDLATRLLLDPGDEVWMEDPGLQRSARCVSGRWSEAGRRADRRLWSGCHDAAKSCRLMPA